MTRVQAAGLALRGIGCLWLVTGVVTLVPLVVLGRVALEKPVWWGVCSGILVFALGAAVAGFSLVTLTRTRCAKPGALGRVRAALISACVAAVGFLVAAAGFLLAQGNGGYAEFGAMGGFVLLVGTFGSFLIWRHARYYCSRVLQEEQGLTDQTPTN